jgi:hypothetical protein
MIRCVAKTDSPVFRIYSRRRKRNGEVNADPGGIGGLNSGVLPLPPPWIVKAKEAKEKKEAKAAKSEGITLEEWRANAAAAAKEAKKAKAAKGRKQISIVSGGPLVSPLHASIAENLDFLRLSQTIRRHLLQSGPLLTMTQVHATIQAHHKKLGPSEQALISRYVPLLKVAGCRQGTTSASLAHAMLAAERSGSSSDEIYRM